MAHEDDDVARWIETASPILRALVDQEPLESIQRLNAIEALVDEIVGVLEVELFNAVFERLNRRAAEVAGRCPVCGLGCERARSTPRVLTKRLTLEVEVWRYRCRACRTNRSPVREWLGLESGATTAGLDRAVTALSTQMSFGSAAAQMDEQHGHEVDRTLVERRTYAVGRDAVADADHRGGLEALADREALREALVLVPGDEQGRLPVPIPP